MSVEIARVFAAQFGIRYEQVGFGVIADNLINIATFTNARATA
jgi:hypothetical protein